jgi:hypothetical protein
MMIASGRIPEEILIDPIRNKYFSTVILDFDVEQQLVQRSPSIAERWTDNTLIAIRDSYQLLASEGPRQHFFYLPR